MSSFKSHRLSCAVRDDVTFSNSKDGATNNCCSNTSAILSFPWLAIFSHKIQPYCKIKDPKNVLSYVQEASSPCSRSRLRRLPKISFKEDRWFALVLRSHNSLLIVVLASKFEQIEVSKWRRRFDIYASKDLEKASVEGHRGPYTIVTRSSDDTGGKIFLTRLYYSQLGLTADVQRVISSKHRILYIGHMPE